MNVPKELIRRVEDRVIETYEKAEKLYGRTFELASIGWELRGQVAGRALYRQNLIRLNPTLLVQNTEQFIAQTVPHEVAHLLN